MWCRKTRRFLLFSRFARASALALGLGLIALPALAADSMSGGKMMMATPSCSADSLHAAMAAMSSKIAAIKLSGSPDRVYAEAIDQMMESEHTLNAWEMKCGKNAKLMKMAGDMQKSLATMHQHIADLTLGG